MLVLIIRCWTPSVQHPTSQHQELSTACKAFFSSQYFYLLYNKLYNNKEKEVKKTPKTLKFFLAVFIIWTLFFFVSSRVVAFENSFDYVSGISYEPIAKLVNFLNDKKNELERYGDRLGKPNTVRHSVSNATNANTANARKSFLLSRRFGTRQRCDCNKPKQYFGKVFAWQKILFFQALAETVLVWKTKILPR